MPELLGNLHSAVDDADNVTYCLKTLKDKKFKAADAKKHYTALVKALNWYEKLRTAYPE